MGYDKQNWKSGDLITAQRLNHIEHGIASKTTSDKVLTFKGTIGTTGDIQILPNANVDAGDLYVVVTAGTYANQICEKGDVILAISDEPEWSVLQTNLDDIVSDVIGVSPVHVATNGSTKTVSHNDSGVTAGSYGDITDQTPAWGRSFKVLSQTVDNKGHVTAAGEHIVTIPNSVATENSAGLMSAADKIALDSKQDKLIIDSEPTENSNNPISSHAVYTALQNSSSSEGVTSWDDLNDKPFYSEDIWSDIQFITHTARYETIDSNNVLITTEQVLDNLSTNILGDSVTSVTIDGLYRVCEWKSINYSKNSLSSVPIPYNLDIHKKYRILLDSNIVYEGYPVDTTLHTKSSSSTDNVYFTSYGITLGDAEHGILIFTQPYAGRDPVDGIYTYYRDVWYSVYLPIDMTHSVHTVDLECLSGENISKLDGKYVGISPDWDESDESSPNFIKNKPCYSEFKFMPYLFETTFGGHWSSIDGTWVEPELIYYNSLEQFKTSPAMYPAADPSGNIRRVRQFTSEYISKDSIDSIVGRPKNLDTNTTYQIILDNKVVYEGKPVDTVGYYVSSNTTKTPFDEGRKLGDENLGICIYTEYETGQHVDPTSSSRIAYYKAVYWHVFLSSRYNSQPHTLALNYFSDEQITKLDNKYIDSDNLNINWDNIVNKPSLDIDLSVCSPAISSLPTGDMYKYFRYKHLLYDPNEATYYTARIDDILNYGYYILGLSELSTSNKTIVSAINELYNRIQTLLSLSNRVNSLNEAISDLTDELNILQDTIDSLDQRVSALESGQSGDTVSVSVVDNNLCFSGGSIFVDDGILMINSSKVHVDSNGILQFVSGSSSSGMTIDDQQLQLSGNVNVDSDGMLNIVGNAINVTNEILSES